MKLFLLKDLSAPKYEAFDAIIVAAESGKEAMLINPDGIIWDKQTKWGNCKGWVDHPKDVIVKYIGQASDEIEQGVILASYNAG